jgi:hypothetical protein
MKRIRIVGLCLMAVFALGAVAAASASAGPPEYKTCVKASPKESGKFNNKTCSTASKGGKKEGDYELGAWNAGKKVTLTGKNGESTLGSYIPENEAEFWTGGTNAGNVTCKKAASKGEITGPKEATTTVSFSSCSSEGKKCTSAGAKAGDIVTKKLTTIIGYIDEGKAVGILVEAGGGGVDVQAAFNCEGLAIETNGSLIGVQSGNVNTFSKESKQSFLENAKGGQEFAFGEFPPESAGVWGPGTEEVHILKTFANPPGVHLPSGEDTVSVEKGETMEIYAPGA